jgi:ABC-type sulfate/molybdate transport systems ATPase subunit
VVFITHDLGLAAAADRVVSMIDGRIESVIAPDPAPAPAAPAAVAARPHTIEVPS